MKERPANKDGRTLYLMRHGDCRRDEVKRYIGQSDPPLSEAGRVQAGSWRQRLAVPPLARVYCSDLTRSIETARIIAEGSSAPLCPLASLREINLGAWEGLAVSDVRRRFPEAYEARGAHMAAFRPPGGESFADLKERVVPAFEDILRRVEDPVLVVGHAGVNRVILCRLLGMPLENLFRIEQEYGGMNVISIPSGRPLKVRSLGLPAADNTRP